MKKTHLKRISLLAFAGGLMACTPKTQSLVALKTSILAAPPQTISLLINNYKPQTGNTFQNIFVSNFSVVARNGNIQYSTARDGLTDVIKQTQAVNYGFAVAQPESAVLGFSDLVLFLSGVTAGQQSSVVCPSSMFASTANDGFTFHDARLSGSPLTYLGLRDCNKTYLGLNTKSFDSNGNGIPDYLELRCGLNPLNKTQAFLSTSSDGVTNLDKCRRNIPITENASSDANQILSYQYSNSMNLDTSLNLSVTNIPIMNGGQDNFIAIYIVETNSNTKASSLYSAFLILPSGQAGKTMKFNYWGVGAGATLLNSQILVP